MQTSQAPPPPQMHPVPSASAPQAGPQQQMMPAAPVTAGPAPPSIPMQHTQYAPQQLNHVQGTTYQAPQQQYVGGPAVQVGTIPHQQQVGQPVAAPVAQAQPQQQQAGQMYPHQGLNGGWQSDQDYNERRKMIAKM
jgi:hypothetical protein